MSRPVNKEEIDIAITEPVVFTDLDADAAVQKQFLGDSEFLPGETVYSKVGLYYDTNYPVGSSFIIDSVASSHAYTITTSPGFKITVPIMGSYLQHDPVEAEQICVSCGQHVDFCTPCEECENTGCECCCNNCGNCGNHMDNCECCGDCGCYPCICDEGCEDDDMIDSSMSTFVHKTQGAFGGLVYQEDMTHDLSGYTEPWMVPANAVLTLYPLQCEGHSYKVLPEHSLAWLTDGLSSDRYRTITDTTGKAYKCTSEHYTKIGDKKHRHGRPYTMPWEKRGIEVSIAARPTKSWQELWPNASRYANISIRKSAADFYLLDGIASGGFTPEISRVQLTDDKIVEIAARLNLKTVDPKKLHQMRAPFLEQHTGDVQPILDILQEADQRLTTLVEELEPVFWDYGQMVGWGELRHHSHIKPFGDPLATGRYTAWASGYYIYEAVGPDSLLDMAAMFREMAGGSSIGGEKWALLAEILYAKVTQKLGRTEFSNKKMFIDRMFTLEHNNGCIFNKLSWRDGSSTLRDLLDAQAADECDTEALLSHASPDVGKLFNRFLDLSKGKTTLAFSYVEMLEVIICSKCGGVDGHGNCHVIGNEAYLTKELRSTSWLKTHPKPIFHLDGSFYDLTTQVSIYTSSNVKTMSLEEFLKLDFTAINVQEHFNFQVGSDTYWFASLPNMTICECVMSKEDVNILPFMTSVFKKAALAHQNKDQGVLL